MNKEKLIEEVRKYNLLYDLSDPKYSDAIKKDEAWTEISKSLAVPVPTCKKTWSNLRESHRRALKKQTTKSGQGTVSTKKWQYEAEMNFLTPHYKERATKSSLNGDSDEESTGNENSLLSAPDHQSSDASMTENRPQSAFSTNTQSGSSTNTSKFSQIKRSKRFVEHGSSASSLLMKYVLDEKTKDVDDIDKFFSSIAATVKKFNEYNRALIKSQVFNIVSQMELQEINETRNNYYGRNNYTTADNATQSNGPSGSGYTTTNYDSQSNATQSNDQELQLPDF